MSQNINMIEKLNEILELEISGVVRYLHYSLMITGPNRIPIVKFFREQANEAFDHAAIIGEKITALGGHPSLKVSPVPETNNHAVLDILRESVEFEKAALQKYLDFLPITQGNVALEELIRGMIKQEQEHIEECEKMLIVSK
ncbi:MAG: bacterioferritin [Deltaproteobacteria bacterium]|nr:bacterioferritin [Deltaproteobacteria bacterium]